MRGVCQNCGKWSERLDWKRECPACHMAAVEVVQKPWMDHVE